MTKVYTKTGDSGTTSLVGGKRVPKNHPRVEAYGDIDELISFIGIIIAESQAVEIKNNLRRIQENLMLVAAHFASDGSSKTLKNIKEHDIYSLEEGIDLMTAQLPEQKAFILPGAPKIASECHVARTICRRSERHALAIDSSDEQLIIGIKYLNRLSDYLFILGRFFCVQSENKEVFWLP